MSPTLHRLAFLFAGLICGQAPGEEVNHAAGYSLQDRPMRTIVGEHRFAEPPLRLYLDTPPGMRLGNLSALPQRPPRIGLEFKLAPTPTKQLSQGTLLRTQLSEGTHLSLRVRRNRVAVVLRSEF